MNCQTAVQRVSEYLDGRLRENDRRDMLFHLRNCGECSAKAEQFRRLRAALRSVPAEVMPPELAVRLRVLASRERALRRRNPWWDWAENLAVRMNELMRPLAIPFAGGLVSAVVLFSMLLMPTLTHQASAIGDVPTMLTTEATLKSALSFFSTDDDIVVDVLIDEQGRMVDYSVPSGQAWSSDPHIRRSVEKTLLCTRFTPATMFGQPASGRLRITLRRSHVDVRG